VPPLTLRSSSKVRVEVSSAKRRDRMRDVRACASCVSLRASALASGTAAARPLPATVYRSRACTLLALAVGVRLGGGYPRSVPGHTAAEVRSLGGAPSAARCANLQAAVLSSLVETEPARSAAPLVTAVHSSSVSTSVVAGLSGWRPRRLAARRKQLSIRAVAEATTAPTRKPRKPAATKPTAVKAARPKAALPKAAPRAKAAPKKPAAGGAAAQDRARGRGRGRGRGGRGGRGRGGRAKTEQQALTPTPTLTLTLTRALTVTMSLTLTMH
jgi:hypothetical protein